MEALGITRLGEKADRESPANSGFQGTYTSADRDMFTVDVSVEAGRGSGLPKMTGSAGAHQPDLNRGDQKFYTAKRTLISRFKLYLFAPRDEIKIEFYLISTAISGKKI